MDDMHEGDVSYGDEVDDLQDISNWGDSAKDEALDATRPLKDGIDDIKEKVKDKVKDKIEDKIEDKLKDKLNDKTMLRIIRTIQAEVLMVIRKLILINQKTEYLKAIRQSRQVLQILQA